MFDKERIWIWRIQQSGHEDSANKLIQRYYKELFAYTYKQVYDQQLAMDLTQEIFIRALQSIQRFDAKKASFRTWLYQIASHHCTDYFRSKAFQSAKRTELMDEMEQEGEDAVTKQVLQNQQLQEIEQVMCSLNEPNQQIIRGKLIEDKTFQELAEQLHIPLSTVKTKYYKAIQTVKLELEASSR